MHVASSVLATEGEGGFWATAYPIIPHPVELIVGFIALAVLYYVVRKYVVPRFEEAYRTRTEAIEGGMERARAAQAEAEAALQQYRAQLQEARGDAARIRAEAQSERATIVEQARVEAQQAAQQVADRSRAQLLADVAAARAELSRDVGRISVDLASKIVGENLADTDRTRGTVDRFIADLESVTAAGPAADGQARGRRGDGDGSVGEPRVGAVAITPDLTSPS